MTLTSFAALALAEAALVGFGAGMVRRYYEADSTGAMFGIVLASVATALMALCFILLGYLSAEKARKTFALPPGETTPIVPMLPKVALALWVLALLIGFATAKAEFWSGRIRGTVTVAPSARVGRTPPTATTMPTIEPAPSAVETNQPTTPPLRRRRWRGRLRIRALRSHRRFPSQRHRQQSPLAPAVPAPAAPPAPPAAAAVAAPKITSVAFAADGRLVTGDDAGTLVFRDLASGRTPGIPREPFRPVGRAGHRRRARGSRSASRISR
jgi:hypothetical protein